MFRHDLPDGYGQDSGMGRDHHYQQGVCDQRFQADRFGQRKSDRGKLLGKV